MEKGLTVNTKTEPLSLEALNTILRNARRVDQGQWGVIYRLGDRVFKIPHSYLTPGAIQVRESITLQPHFEIERLCYSRLANTPGFVRVRSSSVYYIEMDYLAVGSLQNYLLMDPEPESRQVAKWFLQVAKSLGKLHRRGIAFGDLHMGNILLADNLDAVLCDLGGAYLISDRRDGAKMVKRDLVFLGEAFWEIITGETHDEIDNRRTIQNLFMGEFIDRCVDMVRGYRDTAELIPQLESFLRVDANFY